MPIDVQKLDSFSIGDDPKSVGTRWKKWIGSFQIYLEALGKINEKQQKALFLHTAGLEVQEVFNTLNLTGDSLQDAIEGLTNYFAPQANKYFERYQFIEASQESGETIDSFVTKLKKLASTCEFGDLEDRLIEQIIVRSNSQELRKKLLQEKKLNLQKVLEIARAIETANYQSSVIVGKTHNNSSQVNHVAYKRSYQHAKTGQTNETSKPSPGIFKYNKVKPNAYSQKSQGHIGTQKPQKKSCFRCGKQDHYSNDWDKCPASGQTCNNCRKRGHLTNKVLKSYNGTNIEVVGSSQVKVQYKDQEIDYKEVFEDRVGTVKNAQAVLVLKENATPRFSAPTTSSICIENSCGN
ncbi:uncharacterized protein LOC135205183 [Macrobrachium nipponense]|uniref:uncharacterized protein LOC135205183 n=1 Tax=Macrobrachium nipponense TaxID=159736 RepID=UPI0030C828EF